MNLDPNVIPLPAVRRLSLYLRQLEGLSRDGRSAISSGELGRSLGLTNNDAMPRATQSST